MKKLNEKDAKQASGGVGDRIEDLVLTGHVGKDDVKEGQMNDLSNDLKDDWVPEKIVQDMRSPELRRIDIETAQKRINKKANQL